MTTFSTITNVAAVAAVVVAVAVAAAVVAAWLLLKYIKIYG